MELAVRRSDQQGRLMAAPSMVFTVSYAARRLGLDIDVVEELAEQMRPEDGCLSVIDSFAETAEAVTAFTSHGLDYLEELLDQRRSDFMHGI